VDHYFVIGNRFHSKVTADPHARLELTAQTLPRLSAAVPLDGFEATLAQHWLRDGARGY
jgi:hypothetical protein